MATSFLQPLSIILQNLSYTTEDHQLDYINFEGEITEGYGKGQVSIWDEGEYLLESWQTGKIVFFLKGSRLQGKYVLVRTKFRGQKPEGKKQWLFFKLGD